MVNHLDIYSACILLASISSYRTVAFMVLMIYFDYLRTVAFMVLIFGVKFRTVALMVITFWVNFRTVALMVIMLFFVNLRSVALMIYFDNLRSANCQKLSVGPWQLRFRSSSIIKFSCLTPTMIIITNQSIYVEIVFNLPNVDIYN